MQDDAQLNGAGDDDGGARQRGFLSRFFHKTRAKSKGKNTAMGQAPEWNISALKRVKVSDISIPKADIVALPIDADIEDFLNALREHSFSRLPVFRETLDDPLGLVHVKDVFMSYGLELKKQKFSLEPFIRPLIYVPPSMPLLTLLQRMQAEHVHMALVIDEYGGVDGLVTIEDILEEIVGDITDEHDDKEEDLWRLEKPGVYVVDARAEISEFESDTHITLPHPEDGEDVDTIGGLIMTYTGRVPVKDEVIRTDDGFEFVIMDADPRRIKRVRVRPPLLHSQKSK